MHVQERQAWFTLVWTAVPLALFLVLGAIFAFHEATIAVFSLVALTAFAPLIGRKERKAGRVTTDERDLQIGKRAALASFAAFWLLFVGGANAPLLVLGPRATVSLRTTDISAVVFPAVCVVYLVRSLVIIVSYRRGADA